MRYCERPAAAAHVWQHATQNFFVSFARRTGKRVRLMFVFHPSIVFRIHRAARSLCIGSRCDGSFQHHGLLTCANEPTPRLMSVRRLEEMQNRIWKVKKGRRGGSTSPVAMCVRSYDSYSLIIYPAKASVFIHDMKKSSHKSLKI